jgi:imidazolonepropionase-like amidohydrolase
MMVGTDGGGQAPGQSIHQEFDELAKAGLSPLKILQMTTLNPAEFLGRTGTMGSIDVGKNADIVLLDGNPVESVQEPAYPLWGCARRLLHTHGRTWKL